MDRAVLDAYGWSDIPTDCEFLLDYEIDEEEWNATQEEALALPLARRDPRRGPRPPPRAQRRTRPRGSSCGRRRKEKSWQEELTAPDRRRPAYGRPFLLVEYLERQDSKSMNTHPIERWLAAARSGVGKHFLLLLTEVDGARALTLEDLREVVRGHYVDPEITAKRIASLGAPETAKLLSEHFPTRPTARSGDLGEILAIRNLRALPGVSDTNSAPPLEGRPRNGTAGR